MLRTTALFLAALLTLAACAPQPEPQATSQPQVEAAPIPAAPGAEPSQEAQATGPAEAVAAAPLAEPEVAPPPAPKTERVEGNLTCTARLAHQSVSGNVVVPTGANCQLFESAVDGSVVLERGSAITLSATQVGGSVQGEEVYDLVIEGGRVKGSVSLKAGQTARVTDAAVDGNLEFSAQQGNVDVSGNRVGGNLRCEGNAGVSGQNNEVKGNRTGQCAGL
ncbi:hypothetical protein GCM10017783_06540 [Deinococcus piscis]|uniref:DUF3060 domain-containing protein n=1 Tax=Deinococcus piscis TaxID=394230 RepID=A0ABQ3JZI8_9DEIO|nr:hypothetical protein [Deinococcus piscis]GHF97381.1 hypothetical protein GCM10017783_06540 [Deinococcus piscis]